MNETKKRGIIKNIIIIFLAVMLLLTLFSNTIMNRSLPEVSVSNSDSGMINTQIKLNGTIGANKIKQVTLDSARIIDSVNVRRGDAVSRGDVLATLVKGESADIFDLETELQRLEIEYKRMLLGEGDPLVSYRRTIEDNEKALAELDEYIALYPTLEATVKGYEDALAVHENDIKLIDSDIKALENGKKELEKEQKEYSNGGYSSLKELNAAIDKAYDGVEDLADATADAKSARSDALRARSDAKDALDAYNSAVLERDGLLSDISALEDEISEKEDELDILRDRYTSLEEEEDAPEGEGEEPAPVSDNTAELEAIAREIEKIEGEIDVLERKLSDKETKLARVKDSISEMKTLDELESDYSAKKAAYNAADKAYENAKDAEKEAEDSIEEMAESAYEYFQLQGRIDKYDEQIEEKLEEKEALNEKVAEVTELLAKAKTKITKTEKECESERISLVRSIEDAKAAIELAESNGAIEDEAAALDLSLKKREIDRKKKQIADLKSSATEVELLAPVDGVISSVGIGSGDEVSSGTVAFEITMTDMGYTMECSVTNSQAARLRVGQEAEVQYYYWGNKPSVRITQIKSDPNSGGKNKLVTFAVDGDVSDGTSLSLVIGTAGQSYDTILPNSAIREDANGKFILRVVSKSSPLGNRYYAERLDVEVLASDATRSAVDASLSWGDYIITGASVPISDGMQVRMAE